MRLTTLAALVVLTLPTLADAHVSITPRVSAHGATETYTVRILAEGKVATVEAEMDVPEGVIVEVLQSPMGCALIAASGVVSAHDEFRIIGRWAHRRGGLVW